MEQPKKLEVGEKYLSILTPGHNPITAFPNKENYGNPPPHYISRGVKVFVEVIGAEESLIIEIAGHKPYNAKLNKDRTGKSPHFSGEGVGVWVNEKKSEEDKLAKKTVSSIL